jgi:hypothetical protein
MNKGNERGCNCSCDNCRIWSEHCGIAANGCK